MKNLVQEYSEQINNLQRPLALRQLNSKGLRHLLNQEWPTKKNEQWKYTNLSHLKSENLRWIGCPKKEDCLNFLNQQDKNKAKDQVFLFDGHFLPGLSDRFFEANDYLEFINQQNELFSSEIVSFNEATIGPEDVMRSLNCAYSTNVLIVKFKEFCSAIKLRIKNIEISSQSSYLFSTPRVLLHVASKQANCEISMATENNFLTNVIVDVLLSERAQLNLDIHLQPKEGKSILLSNRVHMEEESQLNINSILFGGELTRMDQEVFVEGERTETHLTCAYIAEKNEQVDIRSTVNHHSPKGQSHQYIKGILKDKSKAIVNGRIYIHQGAQEVDSHLLNNNLILSEYSEVNTKPELEVEADNVKASHGATVGQLEEEELFYLASRGIHKEIAQKLLLRGFIFDTFRSSELIDDSQLREALEVYFDR